MRNIWVYLSLIVLFMLSCSPSQNYKILSVFFDGVPDPDEVNLLDGDNLLNVKDSAQILAEINKKRGLDFFAHPPYINKECGSCHDQDKMGKLLLPQPRLCFQCHENFNKKNRMIHGPAAGGYCTACHHPHLSKNNHLLQESGQDLCFQCHNVSDISQNKVHRDIGNRVCTECHSPHGGRNNVFLKEGLCYECHENFNEKYSSVHGPVAAGYCSSCHGMHTSNADKLLVKQGKQLCLECHGSNLSRLRIGHKVSDRLICIECHNPHGGHNRYFLN